MATEITKTKRGKQGDGGGAPKGNQHAKGKATGRKKTPWEDLTEKWNAVAKPHGHAWDTYILYLMGDKGRGRVSIQKTYDISNALWDRLFREPAEGGEVEFQECIKKGEVWRQAWFEEKGQDNLDNKEFQHGLWYMQMKNLFGWKDKSDITAKVEGLGTLADIMLALHQIQQEAAHGKK